MYLWGSVSSHCKCSCKLFAKAGQCSITIAELFAELECHSIKRNRDYHSRFKRRYLILSGTSWQERTWCPFENATWPRSSDSFDSLFYLSTFTAGRQRFFSPFSFSLQRPQLDAFYNCFRSNPNLFDRYGVLSTIFTLRLSRFIDVNFIFIAVTQFEWIDRVHPSYCIKRSKQRC